jgi:hypothetical protein
MEKPILALWYIVMGQASFKNLDYILQISVGDAT